MTESNPYEAILIVSFGGPEGPEDVMPFLRNVVKGKRVPDERLKVVAEHYDRFDGKSPINDQCRALIAALKEELAENGPDLPIYWGNRNWDPFLVDTLKQMKADGITRSVAFVTSAFSSYSGCRQYRENIEAARAEIGEGAPLIDKIRVYYNHPGFIQPMVEAAKAILDEFDKERRSAVRLAFTAHSIPISMAEHCDYEVQLTEACSLVASAVGCEKWQLVYQSRSGPPTVPWLEPDIGDHINALSLIGVEDVVVVPIGFVSDHMEVIWDLDHEAREIAESLGIKFHRVPTVGTHPEFVAMIRELVMERTGETEERRALGTRGPNHDTCPPDCCKYVRSGRPQTS